MRETGRRDVDRQPLTKARLTQPLAQDPSSRQLTVWTLSANWLSVVIAVHFVPFLIACADLAEYQIGIRWKHTVVAGVFDHEGWLSDARSALLHGCV